MQVRFLQAGDRLGLTTRGHSGFSARRSSLTLASVSTISVHRALCVCVCVCRVDDGLFSVSAVGSTPPIFHTKPRRLAPSLTSRASTAASPSAVGT